MWNVSGFEHAETVAQDLGIPPWVFVTVVCLLVLLPLCYMWTCVRNGVQNVRCCVNVCNKFTGCLCGRGYERV